MPSKFDDPAVRGAVVQSIAAGCSIRDAANVAGLNDKTLRNWLARGRGEEHTIYAQFARQVDAAREEARARAAEEPGTADQHRRKVWEAVERGNVQAMKLYWEILQADSDGDGDNEEPADPLEGLDELAERRQARTV